jgi:hypothetical protein
MKRYRILSFDFDNRVRLLVDPIGEKWEENVRKQHLANRQQIEEGLIASYGELYKEAKKDNFISLESKPFSILAFHNRFFEQIRTSFIMGAYYPALTGACALGERILNYLILILRDDYKDTHEYKSIYRKDSFDDWDIPINALSSWGVLLPRVAKDFQRLKEMRNKSIHFRPEVDYNDYELALEAIHCLKDIIGNQFSAIGPKPWFMLNIPGEVYIRKDWESKPLIKRIYLPNCQLVGPKHSIKSLTPEVSVDDNFEYDDMEISDEQFAELRRKSNGRLRRT